MEKKLYQTPQTEAILLETDATMVLLGSGTAPEP